MHIPLITYLPKKNFQNEPNGSYILNMYQPNLKERL